MAWSGYSYASNEETTCFKYVLFVLVMLKLCEYSLCNCSGTENQFLKIIRIQSVVNTLWNERKKQLWCPSKVCYVIITSFMVIMWILLFFSKVECHCVNCVFFFIKCLFWTFGNIVLAP